MQILLYSLLSAVIAWFCYPFIDIIMAAVWGLFVVTVILALINIFGKGDGQ